MSRTFARLASRGNVRRGDACWQGKFGSHVACELEPDVVVRRECVIGGAAVANQSGHVKVSILYLFTIIGCVKNSATDPMYQGEFLSSNAAVSGASFRLLWSL